MKQHTRAITTNHRIRWGAASLLLLCACDSDDPTTGELAIAGTYVDDFDSTHVITDEAWQMGEGSEASLFHIESYSNDDHYLVAQNDEANAYAPGLWSRFDWAQVDEQLYFCQGVFDAPSLEKARDADAPDPADPMQGGCGGFPWSALVL